MSGSKHKRSDNVTGTAKKHQELEAQRKDEEKQEEEELTEEQRDSQRRKWQGDFLYLRRHC